jgi:hypothetical protein
VRLGVALLALGVLLALAAPSALAVGTDAGTGCTLSVFRPVKFPSYIKSKMVYVCPTYAKESYRLNLYRDHHLKASNAGIRWTTIQVKFNCSNHQVRGKWSAQGFVLDHGRLLSRTSPVAKLRC